MSVCSLFFSFENRNIVKLDLWTTILSIRQCYVATKFELITVFGANIIANSNRHRKLVFSPKHFRSIQSFNQNFKILLRTKFISHQIRSINEEYFPISFLRSFSRYFAMQSSSEFWIYRSQHRCQRVKYSWTLREFDCNWKQKHENCNGIQDDWQYVRSCVWERDKQEIPSSQIVIWLFVYWLWF